jgi:hypothetical protein
MFSLASIPLNNREKAIVIWGLAFLVWMVSKRNVRHSLAAVLRAGSRRPILIVYTSCILYVSAITTFWWKVGFWNVSLAKDTVLWLLGTAFALVMSSASENAERDMKGLLVRSLKLGTMLQFMVHLYTFPLIVEIVLVPFLVLMSGIVALTEVRREYASAGKMAQYVLGTAGAVIIAWIVFRVINDYQSLINPGTARAYALPLLLALPFLPFVYALTVYAAYDSLFSRLDFLLRDNKQLARFAKRQILRVCLADLPRLRRFTKKTAKDLAWAEDKAAILTVIQRFRAEEMSASP